MRRVQLIVTFMDDTTRYYPINPHRGWKFDTMGGVDMLIIGNGLDRMFIPTGNTRSIELNQYEVSEHE